MCRRLDKNLPLSLLCVATGQCLRHILSDQIDHVWESDSSLHSYMLADALLSQVNNHQKWKVYPGWQEYGSMMALTNWRRKTSEEEDSGVIVLLIVRRHGSECWDLRPQSPKLAVSATRYAVLLESGILKICLSDDTGQQI